MPDTYCHSQNGCIYWLWLRESSRVFSMLKRTFYMRVGFMKLMPDQRFFVKFENNIIGVPTMQPADYIIEHRSWFVLVLCH